MKKLLINFILMGLAMNTASSSLPHSHQATFIIARHGESDHNVIGYFSGNPKNPNYKSSNLTQKGQNEIRDSAKNLKKELEQRNFKISRAYTSPLPRTRQTLAIYREFHQLSDEAISIEERVIEVDHGDYEGSQFSDFPHHPWNISHNREFSGENGADVKNRVKDFILSIPKEITSNKNEVILIVTHGSPAIFLSEVLMPDNERVILQTGEYHIITSNYKDDQ